MIAVDSIQGDTDGRYVLTLSTDGDLPEGWTDTKKYVLCASFEDAVEHARLNGAKISNG